MEYQTGSSLASLGYQNNKYIIVMLILSSLDSSIRQEKIMDSQNVKIFLCKLIYN